MRQPRVLAIFGERFAITAQPTWVFRDRLRNASGYQPPDDLQLGARGAHPRVEQLGKLAALRGIGKREAEERLKRLVATNGKSRR